MFFKNENQHLKEEYKLLLKSIGSLSNLFSENDVPYLYYRAHENIFCEALKAENLSRSDCSADAKKGKIGIGLKTFLNGKGRSFQKVAEFNKEREIYSELTTKKIIEKISELRNKRIRSTKAIHGVDKMIYHCIARSKDKFIIFEEKMDLIDIKKIKILKSLSKNTIHFKDGVHEYNFNISKSTLFKRFYTNPLEEFEVEISENVYEVLKMLHSVKTLKEKENLRTRIILPLYSDQSGKVEEKSGLNQWNAAGRKRDPNELYIPVSTWIHHNFPSFFPSISEEFNLHLPNGKEIKSKMCQGGDVVIEGIKIKKGKGLMSNPNKDLGKWILRDILNLDEGTLVTYKTLEEIGIDSIEIEKMDTQNYKINFKHLGAFKEFKEYIELNK